MDSHCIYSISRKLSKEEFLQFLLTRYAFYGMIWAKQKISPSFHGLQGDGTSHDIRGQRRDHKDQRRRAKSHAGRHGALLGQSLQPPLPRPAGQGGPAIRPRGGSQGHRRSAPGDLLHLRRQRGGQSGHRQRRQNGRAQRQEAPHHHRHRAPRRPAHHGRAKKGRLRGHPAAGGRERHCKGIRRGRRHPGGHRPGVRHVRQQRDWHHPAHR